MAKVKICGIRRQEDIGFVNKYLPEYVGFIFAPSKRQVAPQFVKEAAKGLEGRIKKVGVFVNEEVKRVIDITKSCGLDVIQIHGDETTAYFKNIRKELQGESVELWKAVRVKDEASIEGLAEYKADGYLLDAHVEGSYGGAGKTFDWSIAVKAKKYGNIILAGGLKFENLIEARNLVQPYIVDVSSGVETDGIKDESKIRDFICIARSY